VSADRFRLSRRQLFGSSALASLGALSVAATAEGLPSAAAGAADHRGTIAFNGAHQAGITTPPQGYLCLATFDVAPVAPATLRSTLNAWSSAALQMTKGKPIQGTSNPAYPPADTGEALDHGAANLTVTIGYGPSLFRSALGLSDAAPAALRPLPGFTGDQLDLAISDGDIVIQACADDPQVAFHAVHTLARLGLGTIALRAIQSGFGRTSVTTSAQVTERNLMGFKDGTNNLLADDPASLDRYVWIKGSTPSFMEGGTIMVYRRIRTRLELWNATSLTDQQQAVGRYKISGAPLTGTSEHDAADFAAQGTHGLPVIPFGAHIRVASAQANDGAKILRRGYGFTDGIDSATGELDAGLVFICFQRDPISQFAAIQRRLSASDTMSTYLVHTATGVYACPGGLSTGQGWGTQLYA
jgi:deferrochelatase/peroxidase EfeB